MTTASIVTLLETALHALSQGNAAQAFGPLKECLSREPNHAQAWFFLGAAHDQCGQIVQAEHAFAECSRFDPTHPQAFNAQAAMLVQLGRTESAVMAFEQALANDPSNAQILTNIGIALEKLQRPQEALDYYSKALAIDPQHLGALNNRGALLLLCGLKEDALQDHIRFTQLAPGSLNGHYFCAETYAALHHDKEALNASEAALAIDPKHAKSLFSRAVSLSSLRRWAEAEQAFVDGLNIAPDAFGELLHGIGMDRQLWTNAIPDPRNIYFLRQQDRVRQCNWQQYDDFVSTLLESLQLGKTSPRNFHLDSMVAHTTLGLPLTLQQHADVALSVAAGIASNRPVSSKMSRPTSPSITGSKLRIGYVSPDYREHATTHLTRRLYALHDRTQFTIHCYSLHSDGSSPAIQKEIAAGCDVFRDVSMLTSEAIDALIREDEIEILIDLAGHTAYSRMELFAAKPAAVNAAYLGYAGSTGLASIDYYIGDAVTCHPEQAPYFTEKLVTMPRVGFCYNNMQTIAPPLTRSDYGLPPTGFVFCCLNNSWKLEPTVFDSWMRILHRVPDSLLWLYKPQPDVEKNLRAEAQKRGVDPMRLVFGGTMQVDQHLARYQVADLFLDTFYYGGHTTALDALWAGCPVLTKPGDHYASRVSASHLTTLEMPELIVDSIIAYENMAVELANDRDRLQQLRAKVTEKRKTTSLFDTADLVRNLERAYLAIWQRHVNGLEPAAIHLQ